MKIFLLALAISVSNIFGTYTLNDIYPDVRITVEAPQILDPSKPTEIIFYALPNGNSIEWTAGKWRTGNDDWHFDIQHISAQTKFLRSNFPEKNHVTVYLMDEKKSWGSWKSRHADILPETLEAIISEVSAIYGEYSPTVTLSSHSGGGYFLFEYIRTAEPINPLIHRFAFLDSTYGYLEEAHRDKLAKWLKDKSHYLSVISYEDITVIYNGKPLVSKEGGTWGRSHAMIRDLGRNFRFKEQEDSEKFVYRALGGRACFKLIKNPEGKIWHTVLVEKNGFIDSALSGTENEGKGYTFWGERAYTRNICDAGCNGREVKEDGLKPLPYFETHKGSGLTGWDYVEKIDDLDFWEFEKLTEKAILEGDVPDSLKFFKKIRYDRLGHVIEFWTLPDYLAIGTNEDFVRIPMGIISSKEVAKALECTLPTTFLADRINDAAEGALDIFPFRPLRGRNSLPIVFQDHNNALKALYKAKGYHFGQFISGLKKDLVQTWYIDSNPEYRHNIAIYGWHHPDGHPQQPLFLRHADFYSDYSHGTRLIWHEITIDGKTFELDEVMRDPQLYLLVSDEPAPLIN